MHESAIEAPTYDTVEALRKARGELAIQICRLTDKSDEAPRRSRERTWREVDACLGNLSKLTRRSFQDVRIGKRNMSDQALQELRQSLKRKAKYLPLSVFTQSVRKGI